MKYIDGNTLSLSDDGVCIINNVLDEKELIDLRTQMWDYLHHLTKNFDKPIQENDTSTYRTFFDLFPKHGMLLQHWDVGHNPMSWYIRQKSTVINVFKDIWKNDDLLTSFDGLSISLPCEITNRGWHKNKIWFHTDQSFLRNDFECVQGLVNLYDVHDGDATLRFKKGSHNLHEQFRHHFNITSKKDWYKLNVDELNFYENCDDLCVKANAGSLVLWDSRTIHQGVEPQKTRLNPNIRCALYVCMTPKNLITATQLKKKQKAFIEQRTTNHYPHKIKLFPINPLTYSQPLPIIDKYDLKHTNLMKLLAGL